MPTETDLLPPGTLVGDRFEIESPLGRGGFGIVYRAKDTARGDHVAIKELAPVGSRRRADGVLEIDSGLRRRFLDEAETMARLNVPGVPPVRATWAENGTAYFASEYYANVETLSDRIAREGKLDVEDAMGIFHGLLDTLEAIHKRGVLHRDVKPSNVLITPSGHVRLIDFGAAREWGGGLTMTAVYTPGYAPPEQMSERARRGPASDLYALCATAYHMLTGRMPVDAAARLSGEAMPSVRDLRPEVEPAVSHAIAAGMALAYAERPADAQELRDQLNSPLGEVGLATLECVDERLFQLQRFAFDKRACPACGNLLQEAKPLRAGACPVCREGSLRRRRIPEGQCPVCQLGILRAATNRPLVRVCPSCRAGSIAWHRRMLRGWEGACTRCGAAAKLRKEGIEVGGRCLPADDWLATMHRAEEARICEDCEAQFDVLPDGRWKQISPEPKGKYRSLYPDEWFRVAAGLPPSVGNAECGGCGADYYLEDGYLTLLAATEDPFGFAEGYTGRRLKDADVRWLGAGKESPNRGLACDGCPTEFDFDGDLLRLERTPNRRLARTVGASRTLEDWHRLAQGLPSADQEEEFERSMGDLLRQAYVRGEIGFDDGGLIAWSGPATGTCGTQGRGTLEIDNHHVAFNRILKRERWNWNDIDIVTVEGDELRLGAADGPIRFEVHPVQLTVAMKSGKHSVELDVNDLAARLLRS